MEPTTTAQSGWQIFAIGSAIFAAATAILGKVGVVEMNSNQATLIRTIVIVIFAACIVQARGEWQPITQLPRMSLLMLVLSGIATGLSWLCYFRALQMAPASKVAPIDKLSVALVILFSILFLGEPLTWKLAIGASLILAGVLTLAF